MAYFSEFPYINYQFPDNIARLYKNINIRPALRQEVFDNAANFETYTVKEGETPETIAYDLYGSVNYHWTIMLANNMLNVYTDWPKTQEQLEDYLYQKYKMQKDVEGNNVELTRDETFDFVRFVGNTDNSFSSKVTTDEEDSDFIVTFNNSSAYVKDSDSETITVDKHTSSIEIRTVTLSADDNRITNYNSDSNTFNFTYTTIQSYIDSDSETKYRLGDETITAEQNSNALASVSDYNSDLDSDINYLRDVNARWVYATKDSDNSIDSDNYVISYYHYTDVKEDSEYSIYFNTFTFDSEKFRTDSEYMSNVPKTSRVTPSVSFARDDVRDSDSEVSVNVVYRYDVTIRPHHFITITNDSDVVEYSYDFAIDTAPRDAFGNTIVKPKLRPISIYEYEFELNEAKREIVTLRFQAIQQIERELRRVIDG